MGVTYLRRDTPTGLDAFAPGNLLIFLSSIIAGHRAPELARFSVVSKSPLSGGVALGYAVSLTGPRYDFGKTIGISTRRPAGNIHSIMLVPSASPNARRWRS